MIQSDDTEGDQGCEEVPLSKEALGVILATPTSPNWRQHDPLDMGPLVAVSTGCWFPL